MKTSNYSNDSEALDALRPRFFRRILVNLGLAKHRQRRIELEDTKLACRLQGDPQADVRKLQYSEKNPFSL